MDSARFQRLSAAIQASHLQVALDGAITATVGQTTAEVLSEAKFSGIDNVPVLNAAGDVIGILSGNGNQTNRVEHDMRSLVPGLLVSSDTSVAEVLEHLTDESFLFVLQGRKVSGFITPSDIEKAEARTYLYLVLSDLELALSELLRASTTDQQSLPTYLSERRRDRLLTFIKEQEERDNFVDIVAALDFADLLTIAGRTHLRHHFAVRRDGAEFSFNHRSRGLDSLRNAVMHPVRNLESISSLHRKVTASQALAAAAREMLPATEVDRD